MPTSSTPSVPVPIPDAVELLAARGIPARVLDAEVAADEAARNVKLCRTPETREALAYNLRRLAACNKVLAAYNPGLIVTFGGAS